MAILLLIRRIGIEGARGNGLQEATFFFKGQTGVQGKLRHRHRFGFARRIKLIQRILGVFVKEGVDVAKRYFWNHKRPWVAVVITYFKIVIDTGTTWFIAVQVSGTGFQIVNIFLEVSRVVVKLDLETLRITSFIVQ